MTRKTSLFGVAVVPGRKGGQSGDPLRFRPPLAGRALCFLTVMHAEPSVARKRRVCKRALFRFHVATSVGLVPVTAGLDRAVQEFESFYSVEVDPLTPAPVLIFQGIAKSKSWRRRWPGYFARSSRNGISDLITPLVMVR